MLRDPNLIPLSHQHHNGLAPCVLTNRSLVKDGSPENLHRLANPFAIDEEVLFAALNISLVARPRQDHRRLELLVDTLRQSPFEPPVREFTALLHSHIRIEESGLFEQAQQLLSREALDQPGAEIDRRAVRNSL
ncbi:MAG: hypothetical protein LC126_07315 [Bryobacterales bacterium]|nr:hypothetical protein [Bryobacterales bacterium]